MIYFPYVYKTIPVSYDDSVSYYAQLLALNAVLEDVGKEIATIENTLNTITDDVLKEVKVEINKLKNELAVEITALQDAVNKEITEFKDDVELSLQDFSKEIRKIENELNSTVLSLNEKMDKLGIETDGKLNSLDLKWNAELDKLDIRFSDDIADVRQEIDGIREVVNAVYEYIDEQNVSYWTQLKEYCDEIYKSRTMYYVTNPITKAVQNVNEVLEMLWKMTNHMLTAGEYAYLKLTAQEYAKLEITALEYLRYLRDKYLHKYFHDSMNMWNPFEGRQTNVIEVVQNLIDIHKRQSGITAQRYADKGMTAQEYADLNLTAQNYLLYGLQFF